MNKRKDDPFEGCLYFLFMVVMGFVFTSAGIVIMWVLGL